LRYSLPLATVSVIQAKKLKAAVTDLWKTKPSWYLLVTEDKMIPPAGQRFMSQRAGAPVDEVAGSHAIYVSRPDVVAAIIKKAAGAAKAAAT